MLKYISDGDLVITDDNTKINILKQITEAKKIINVKFMTINEFKKNYFGTYDERALYYLIKKYKFKYDIAKEYLENIFFDVDFLKPYYYELKEKDLLIENKMFKSNLNSIVVINYNGLDEYAEKELKKYNTKFVHFPQKKYTPSVYGFKRQEDEIAYVATSIIKDLEKYDINDIFLINVTDEYKTELKRIFQWYNIPINLEKNQEIYSTKIVQDFIKRLSDTRDINESILNMPNNDISNKIISILNKYNFITDSVDEIFLEIIKNELKTATIPIPHIDNAVNVQDMRSVVFGKRYYIIGFNQGSIPRKHQDDKLIKDIDRKKIGLNTSLQELKNEKKYLLELLSTLPNLTITYKLKDNYNTYYPSSLLENIKSDVVFNPSILLNYSNAYNKIKLSRALDDFIKYNEKDENLESLYSTYTDIPYQIYNNSFTQIEFDDMKDYLGGKINLSYSSMNNYFLCAFRFYVSNILKLEPYEENFAAFVGSLFHECLSHMYEENFDLKKIYNEYIQSRNGLTAKEKFFVEKLYKNLEFIIKTIKKQESYSKFNEVLTEEKISIDMSSKLTINFLGFVDKIKYVKDENGKVLVAIIDYKTGAIPTTLDNINHGLHLQLPVYIYLTRHGLHKEAQIVGFYLQKILNQPDVDVDNVDDDLAKKLRLEGYTINDQNLIKKFDETYVKSEVVKGLGITQKGFSYYSKIVSNDDIDKIENITEEKIKEVIAAIENANFEINPKRIDNKIIGCEFCKFKDLCFKKEEDIKNLINTKFEDIEEGDDSA